MSNLEIQPYIGIGPIRLGMSADEVRDTIGIEYRSFLKTPAAQLPTDAFQGVGIHVYYREPNVCKAVELHPPAVPTFRGNKLIGQPFDKVAVFFKNEDPSIQIDESGLTSKKFGINLYAPDLDESPVAPVKAVIVFEKGYYG